MSTAMVEPPAPPAKKRRRAASNRYLFVRHPGKGSRWEARPWVGLPYGFITLGLYETERAAWQAVKEWLRAGGTPTAGLPEHVQPKWVKVNPDGTYSGQVRLGGILVERGPYPDPITPHVEVREIVRAYRVRKRVEVNRRQAAERERREAEVKAWRRTAVGGLLAEGADDVTIAATLGLRPGTAQRIRLELQREAGIRRRRVPRSGGRDRDRRGTPVPGERGRSEAGAVPA